MQQFISYLQGKKTYLIGVITALIGLLQVFGVIHLGSEQLQALMTFLGALFAMSLGAKITRLGKRGN